MPISQKHLLFGNPMFPFPVKNGKGLGSSCEPVHGYWESSLRREMRGGSFRNKEQNKYSLGLLIPLRKALLTPRLCRSAKLARCGRNAKGIHTSKAIRGMMQWSSLEGGGELNKLCRSDRKGCHPPSLTGFLERLWEQSSWFFHLSYEEVVSTDFLSERGSGHLAAGSEGRSLVSAGCERHVPHLTRVMKDARLSK